MNWLKIAVELFQHLGSSGPSVRPPRTPLPPDDVRNSDPHSVISLLSTHRAEVEKNLQAVAQILKAQSDQQILALRTQRRWNYGLAIAVVLIAIVAVAAYLR